MMINWLELGICLVSCLLAHSVASEMGVTIPPFALVIILIGFIGLAYLDRRRHQKDK